MSTEDDRVRIRVAEFLSSGGVGYNQISQEILYLMPTEFVNWYIQLWEKALGPAGTGDSIGQQLGRDAELGKAQTKTKDKGNKVGAGAGGQGKKWKRVGLSVRDEVALEFKDRIDKKLRSLARDIRTYDSLGSVGIRVLVKCPRCRRIMDDSWRFCPQDGSQIENLTVSEL